MPYVFGSFVLLDCHTGFFFQTFKKYYMNVLPRLVPPYLTSAVSDQTRPTSRCDLHGTNCIHLYIPPGADDPGREAAKYSEC